MNNIGVDMPVGLYEKALPVEWPWEKRLAKTAQAGYDFVDISIDESDDRLARLDWSVSKRAALRQAITNTGVPILTMCLSGHRKYSLGSRSQETRQHGLEIMRKAIEFAGDIGVRIIQVMGYDVFYEPSDDQTKGHFIESLQQSVCWAGWAGVMLGLENVDNPFLESVEKGLRLVQEVNSPWFHLYPDMANLAAAGYDPPAELALAKGHLLAVHVKDALPRIIRGVPFETGIVPFTKTFQTLAQIDFSGPLGVEMWADMDTSGDPFTSAVAARQLVQRLINVAWPKRGLPEINGQKEAHHVAESAS
jgi:predicted hexulose-6-phosphate isomerase